MVTARQREQIGEREAGFEEPQAGAQDVGVGRGVARRVVALLGDDQTLPRDRVEQRRRHADTRGEVVEREQLGVAGLRAGDRGGERSVGGVELAGEEAADHREREPLALELLDALEALDVVGAVPGDATLAAGRWQQLALLVEADGVDRHVGPAGQFLDPDVGGADGRRGVRDSHERRF